MKINFRKSISQSYMVISDIEEPCENDFASRLLRRGHVPHLLDLESETIDSAACLLYDISGKQSFEKTFETEKMSYKNLCAFLDSLEALTESMADYLLDCDSILMEPNTIFTNHEKSEYFFCYYPPAGFSSQAQLRALFNSILSLIDYEDPQAVTLAFSLNRISQSDSFTIADIKEALNKPEENELIYDQVIAEQKAFFQHTQPFNNDENISHTNAPSFIGKAKSYFGSNSFGDIIDDINSGKIIRRIKSQPAPENTQIQINSVVQSESGITHQSSGNIHQLPNIPGIAPVGHPTIQSTASGSSTDLMAVYQVNDSPTDYLVGDQLTKSQNTLPESQSADETSADQDSITRPLALSSFLTHKLIGSGQVSDRIIVIDNFPFSIGKSPSCNYRLCFSTVSRVHCRIYIDSENPEALFIEDMNSTNGTFINDKRLDPYEKHPLNSDDVVRLSEFTFVFR